jgi:type IV secretion system protein VirB11
LYEKLYRDMGDTIIASLQDPNVNEIMLNPDGTLWVDSVNHGQVHVGHFTNSQAYAIIFGVAGIHGFVVNQSHPCLEAELPNYQALRHERFTAQVPPIVSAPCFTLRKRSERVFSLDDYVSTGRMTPTKARLLRDLVTARKNILVCGGPGSGKTTVTNALIHEAVEADENQRFLILEDLPELQCRAPNTVALLTSQTVNMQALLRAAMRMRPDRILIGEVRGSEALDMLKAWNTGCPGGLCTVHANGAEEAMQRILDLAMEAGLTKPPIELAAQTIDVLVSVTRLQHQKGFIQDILSPGAYRHGEFTFEKLD